MQVDRKFIKSISHKENFQPDIIEKIYRLMLLLQEIARHPFLSKELVLKGGTAINFLYLPIPRLSIDLDFDFIGTLEKEEKDKRQKDIKNYLERIFIYFDYRISEKTSYGLHQFFLRYNNSARNIDLIKLEINYLLRISILPHCEMMIRFPFFKDIKFITKTLSIEEIYAIKVKTLLERTIVRDLFDVYSLIKEKIKVNKASLRKLFIFFGCIARKDFREFSVDCLDDITEKDIRNNLVPLIRKGEIPSRNKMINAVTPFIKKLFSFSDNERIYIDSFYNGKYSPELLFENIKTIKIDNIKKHPMALWKQMKMKG